MVRMTLAAVCAVATLSCSSRGGSPDASVAVPVAPPAPAQGPLVGRPTDAPPPTQFRRPAFDKAVMDQAIQAYERTHGPVRGAPPPPPAQP
jgi:hypothetical protein